MTRVATPTASLPGLSIGAIEKIRDTADLLVSDPETADVDQIRDVARTLLTLLNRQAVHQRSTPARDAPTMAPATADHPHSAPVVPTSEGLDQ